MTLSWVGAAMMGLTGSGHCGAMCGGIASSASAPGSGRGSLAFSLNAGRLLSYTFVGALVGGVSSLFGEIALAREATIAIRGVMGVLVLALGVALALGMRSVRVLDRAGAPLWRRLRPYAQRLAGPTTPMRALGFGALWGFLPCGLVYAAVGMAAASGSAGSGALTMLFFGAGTLPALVLLGSIASRVGHLMAQPPIRALAGILVALSGIVNVASAWPDVWGVRMFAATTHACCHPQGAR